LEGLALYADPDFNVLATSYPYFAKMLLTDPNLYLTDALIELLFKDGMFRHKVLRVLYHYTHVEISIAHEIRLGYLKTEESVNNIA
ncbi:hypothetical protein J1N35_028980, partial [Gossypium stocksii]